MVAKGEEGGRGVDWESGVGKHYVYSKILMYGRQNYIQYPVINHNGREHKIECIYVHNGVTLLYSSDRQNIIINCVCVSCSAVSDSL